MCLYPTFMPNGRYKKTKKNGGIIPTVYDTRVLIVPWACGQCIECRRQKQREWQARLEEDIKINKNGKMVTLTLSNQSYKLLHDEVINDKWREINKLLNNNEYTNEEKNKIIEKLKEKMKGYGLDNEIITKAVRKFTERWRKKHETTIRHWLVSELGHNGTENIHLHGIIWTNEKYTEIRDKWKYGYIYPRNEQEERKAWVNAQTTNYIIKYISKQDKLHKAYKSIILNSKGIGKAYTDSYNSKLNKYNGEETKEYYITKSGHKISLPKYWKNKIYTDEEKEQLWINLLNKQKRYVLGKEISIKDGDEEYYNALEEAQRKNKQLGYGDKSTIWKRKEYEEERRKHLQQKRLQ